MKNSRWYRFFLTLLIPFFGFIMTGGCDSASDAIDEATGNRAVKQYHRTKKKLDEIAEQQAARYGNIPDEETEEEDE